MFHNQTACPAPGVRRRGFTLIEMLVVLLIIAILSGMVFALMGVIGSNADKADTRRRVEMLANAIEEFRSEYGKYPPVPQYNGVQPVYYEWPILNEGIFPPDPSGGQYGLTAAQANSIMQAVGGEDYADDPESAGRLFTFGLASFLMTRFDGNDNIYPSGAGNQYTNGFGCAAPAVLTQVGPGGRKNPQWYDHNSAGQDGERDRRAAARMKYYVDKAGVHKDWRRWRKHGSLSYANRYLTFWDAWRRDLRYESHPPYDSYKVWSVGPDGENGTDDDIVAGKEGL